MNAVVEALGAVPWLDVVDWAGALLLTVGVFFCLVAAIGLLRLPDTFSRMHAASKPQLVGLVFVCTGIVLDTLQWRWVVLGVVVVSLQILTAPVGSHLLGRAVSRTESAAPADLVIDELAEDTASSSLHDGS